VDLAQGSTLFSQKKTTSTTSFPFSSHPATMIEIKIHKRMMLRIIIPRGTKGFQRIEGL
jgi:hypothetical protein